MYLFKVFTTTLILKPGLKRPHRMFGAPVTQIKLGPKPIPVVFIISLFLNRPLKYSAHIFDNCYLLLAHFYKHPGPMCHSVILVYYPFLVCYERSNTETHRQRSPEIRSRQSVTLSRVIQRPFNTQQGAFCNTNTEFVS